RQEADARKARGDLRDRAVGRAVVDDGDHRAVHLAELRLGRGDAGDRVALAVPVDDDDVDRWRGQVQLPMRRLMRSRIDGGCSGTCRRAANASFVASARGALQNATSGASVCDHWWSATKSRVPAAWPRSMAS